MSNEVQVSVLGCFKERNEYMILWLNERIRLLEKRESEGEVEVKT